MHKMKNLMNPFACFWPKFKQELLPILFLSLVQIWWNFNFPFFMRLGTPWNSMTAICSSIVSTALIIYAFSCVKGYPRRFNGDGLEKEPYDFIFKNIDRICFAIVANTGMFFIWYNDVYSMSNLQYFLFYAYGFIMFALLHRAMNRMPLK